MVDRRIAYELEGVLAEIGKGLVKPWRDLDRTARQGYRQQQQLQFAKAKCLRQPMGEFFVISARRANFETVTQRWLDKHFPGKVRSLMLLDRARTHDNILAFKVRWLKEWRITEYWEPDPRIVRELQTQCPGLVVRWSRGSVLTEKEGQI